MKNILNDNSKIKIDRYKRATSYFFYLIKSYLNFFKCLFSLIYFQNSQHKLNILIILVMHFCIECIFYNTNINKQFQYNSI